MKANRKFRRDDDAVSPVIAVILMVAITVVLAATVYVWVSGFGSQSSQPAKTISLTSAGALSTNGWKNFTVASATSGVKYSDLTITVDGTTRALDAAATCGSPYSVTTTTYGVCRGATAQQATAVALAGDTIVMRSLSSGQSIKILDSQANSVIYSSTIG